MNYRTLAYIYVTLLWHPVGCSVNYRTLAYIYVTLLWHPVGCSVNYHEIDTIAGLEGFSWFQTTLTETSVTPSQVLCRLKHIFNRKSYRAYSLISSLLTIFRLCVCARACMHANTHTHTHTHTCTHTCTHSWQVGVNSHTICFPVPNTMKTTHPTMHTPAVWLNTALQLLVASSICPAM